MEKILAGTPVGFVNHRVLSVLLYESSATRSTRCRWLLQELGVPFESVSLQLCKGEQFDPAFLKLNPFGRVPVLVDGQLVLRESIAICFYLAEKYADRGFIPPSGTAERGQHDQWTLFCATELEQPLWQIRRHTLLYPEEKRLQSEVEVSIENFHKAAAVLEDELACKKTLLGDQFMVADIATTCTLWWANRYRLLDRFPALRQYMESHLQRERCPQELR